MMHTKKHELHNKKSIFLDILGLGDTAVFLLVASAVVAGMTVFSEEGEII